MNAPRLLVRGCVVPAAMLWLAACSQPSAPAPQAVRSADRLIAAIQEAGARDRSVVHVVPLRDPAVKRLLEQARYQEAARNYRAAAALLDEALRVTPDAPGILQDRAELAVRLGDYAAAERLARRSYAVGPRLGSLCARNWQTVLEMRQIANDAAGTRDAHQHLSACEEPGPIRM